MSTNPNNLVPMPPRVWSDTLTPPRREALWIAAGLKCHWCGKPTRLCAENADDQATIEHIIPRYKGGTNDSENLTSACRACNGRRSYEDARNMREGALLGKWPMKDGKGMKRNMKRTCLTGDEKKAIIKKTSSDVHLEQRDQALREIGELRKEIKLYVEVVKTQEEELKALRSLTVWKLIRKRIAEWVSPK